MDNAILSTQTVRFAGPALTRQSRGALSAAGVTIVERRPSAAWGGQLQEYLVVLEARDGRDAIARVRAAIEIYGAYSPFVAEPR